MTNTKTSLDATQVTGNIFLPSTEPIVSILMQGDDIECDLADDEIEGTIVDTDYLRKDEEIDAPVDVEQAYRAQIRTDGRETVTLIQSLEDDVVTLIDGECTAPVTRLSLQRE